MIKQNKKMIILTSIVTLLPMVIGLLLWNQLPQLMATHFNFNGQPNGYSSKTFTVFVLPLILQVLIQSLRILIRRYFQSYYGSVR